MTLYQIIQTKVGKETIKMVDSLPKCNNRLKELRSSYRGKTWIRFRIEKAESDVKFEAKPAPSGYQSGDVQRPKIVRKK